MQIQVNGESREVATEVSVAQLLEGLQLDPRTLAVELNLELVPRGEHLATQLTEGDKIEVVTLFGGG